LHAGLIEVGGKLTGVTGITVGAIEYNVEFVTNGSCQTLFSGCDSADDFVFDDLAAVAAATQALIGQHLL
jgi:hypothetical protein